MKIYGFLLLGLGIFAGFISTLMFGDIAVSGYIGSLAIVLTGLGFINLAMKKK